MRVGPSRPGDSRRRPSSAARQRLPFRRCGSPLPVATLRFPEALGGSDRVRAGLRRDPHGRAPRRPPRPRRRAPRDGPHRRRRQPGRPPRRVLRRRLGGPAPAPAAAHRGGRGPGPAPLLDPARLRDRRPADGAALPGHLRRGLPRHPVRRGVPGLRPVAHRGRSRRRGQQQARDELVHRRDRRPGTRRQRWSSSSARRSRSSSTRCRSRSRRSRCSSSGRRSRPARPGRSAPQIRREIVEGAPARPPPSGAVPDRRSLGRGPRRRGVLRGALHDLPHRRPPPRPVAARHRRVGRRGRLARRLASSRRRPSAASGSGRPSSGARQAPRRSAS